MEQIWDELGSRINELLELGKAGVVASILAACQRLETKRLEVFTFSTKYFCIDNG
jgi:nucleolar protein 9